MCIKAKDWRLLRGLGFDIAEIGAMIQSPGWKRVIFARFLFETGRISETPVNHLLFARFLYETGRIGV